MPAMLLLAGLSFQPAGADSLETGVATLPEGLRSPGIAAYDGKVFILGGTLPNGTLNRAIWAYDPLLDSLQQRPVELPVIIVPEIAVATQEGIFLFSRYCYDGGQATLLYHPENETVEVVTFAGGYPYGGTMCFWGTHIVQHEGMLYSLEGNQYGSWVAHTDLASRMKVTISSPHIDGNHRWYYVLFSAAGDLWAVGYHNETDARSLQRLKPDNTWEVIDMPDHFLVPNGSAGPHTLADSVGYAVVEDRLILLGGRTNGMPPYVDSQQIVALDPVGVRRQFSTFEIPTHPTTTRATTLGGAVYFMGSADDDYYSPGDPQLYRYDPHPTAPTGFSIRQGAHEDEAELDWTASPGEGVLAYDVYRGNSSSGPFARVATVEATEYYDGPLATGTYHYFVKAVSGAGFESAATSTQSVALVATQDDPGDRGDASDDETRPTPINLSALGKTLGEIYPGIDAVDAYLVEVLPDTDGTSGINVSVTSVSPTTALNLSLKRLDGSLVASSTTQWGAAPANVARDNLTPGKYVLVLQATQANALLLLNPGLIKVVPGKGYDMGDPPPSCRPSCVAVS